MIDEVGLTDNLIAYWNLDTILPSYPDSISSSYKQYNTQAQWQGSEISVYNSTIDTATTPDQIIVNAPSVGGNSGITFTFTSAIPTGTTLLQIYAYGTSNTLYVDAINSYGTVTKTVGTFGGNGTPQWQTFYIEIGSYPITSLRLYINATNYTAGSYPTGYDIFYIDYVNMLTDTQYFNNTFTTADSWANATVSSGNLIQTNTTISRAFTPNLLNQRFRASVKIISGTNPIISINGINKVITTDGNYNIVDIILPSTTTVSIVSTGNILSYSFIYIGLGSYVTYEPDCINGTKHLYPVGASSVTGVSGNACSFYNAYLYSSSTFSLSAPISFAFLININQLPTSSATIGATLVGATNGYPSVGINYLGNIVFTFVDTTGTTQNLIGKIALLPNTWHYIVATHSGSVATIYTDGSPDPSFTSTLQSTTNSINIGAFDTVNTLPFNGTIEDVRIFSTVLSASDILTQNVFFSSLITGTSINYASSIKTRMFVYYYCNDTLSDPPDGNRIFYMDCFTSPYNLTNTPMLNTTVKTNNTTSVLFSSVTNTITGFTIATSIATGNNYFRINVKNNDQESLTRNLYVAFYNNATLLSTAALLSTSSFSTLEYIHTFGSTITSIQVYMNDTLPAYGFEVAWIYMGTGIDTTKLIDYSGNNNSGSLVEVFSDTTSGIDFTGSSSLTIPATTYSGDFSFSLWINPASLSSMTFLSKSMPAGYTVNPFSVNIDANGNINLIYATSTSTITTLSTTTKPIVANTTNHIAIEYASHVYSICVNGNQLVTNADIFSDNSSTTIVGSSFIGSMNNIRIYTRAITIAEVKYLYSHSL